MDIKSLINKFTIYYYMISFLIILNLVSVFFYGFGINALLPVLIAVITTTLLDLFIEYFKSKMWMFPQSALISGLFIGGLLTQNLQWYIYVIAGVIAIASKHIIKVQQKHIFNPANFGVLLISIIFGVSHTWWISSPLILVLIFGILIIWRLKRFDLAISFLIGYYLINSIIELSQGAPFQEIYFTIINGGVIYFFSMYMLIEPKTHPSGRNQRIVYGILVAILFIVFHFFIPRHDLPLALAVGNIFVPILNKLKLEFGKKEEAENTQ
ncbi:MAG: RnfABCDGE type electron transport complex subunit D [Nanoarchaeota archaeon]|nr:RnfABCDGE type electron transport complex subunit D [Nanoarchaeota archaeon]